VFVVEKGGGHTGRVRISGQFVKKEKKSGDTRRGVLGACFLGGRRVGRVGVWNVWDLEKGGGW